MNNFLGSFLLSLVIILNPMMAREAPPSFVAHTEEQYIYYNVPLSEYQQNYVQNLCEKYDLSYELVLAVMKVESNFDINAISDTGSSQGIMQINKNTAPWIAKQLGIKNYDMFNFGHCTNFGCYNLAYHRSYWKDKGYSDEEVFDLMLSSYHYGIAGCKKKGIAKSYVNKVYEYKVQLEESNWQIKNEQEEIEQLH